VVVTRLRPTDVPTIIWRLLSKRAPLGKHRHVHPFTAVEQMKVTSLDDRPLPLQVDGDYIGEAHEALFGVTPRGIAVVA
jgi:diacylglycerol kinase family enzyme